MAERGASSGEVTIGGRVFRLGVVYAPRRGLYGRRSKPRRLLRHAADSLLPEGRVDVAVLPSGRRQIMAGTAWAAWAGAPVGGDLEDIGR